MVRFILTAIALTLLPTLALCDITYFSYAFAKQYAETIPRKALEKSPSWNGESENPPLSARKAIKLANEVKDTVVKDSKEIKWKLREASLVPTDDEKWYWLVYYEGVAQGFVISGIPPHLRLVVLMDGTVIKPEVNDYP